MTEDKKMNNEKAVKADPLLDAACKAYGIEKKFVFAHSVKAGEVTIVTNGGAKVRWKKGDEVEPLEPVRVDGIVRKKPKVIAGKKKKAEEK